MSGSQVSVALSFMFVGAIIIIGDNVSDTHMTRNVRPCHQWQLSSVNVIALCLPEKFESVGTLVRLPATDLRLVWDRMCNE